MTDKTHVVMGCTIESDYSLPLPITCLLWRELVGFEPRVYIVGSLRSWCERAPLVTLNALSRHRIEAFQLSPYIDYPDGTVAKHIRQHAAAERFFCDDDWVMPADADLWPLVRDFYHQHEGAAERAVLYYSNGDHFTRKDAALDGFDAGVRFFTIPMCHATMRARDWRAAWNLVPDDMSASLIATFKRYGVNDASRVPDGETPAAWKWWVNSDQRLLTERLCRQDWFPAHAAAGGGTVGAVRFIERRGGPPRDRLDRAFPHVWHAPFEAGHYTDAHLPKEPERPERWARLLPIVDALLPQHSAWARSYYAEYMAAR